MARKIKRRRLLQGLGAGAAALPFLRNAPSAAAGEFPTRILFYFLPNEPINRSYWRPAGAGNEFALTDPLPSIFAPLDAHRQDLLMLGNIEFKTHYDDWPAGHVGAGHVLTGRTNVLSSYQAESIIFFASGISVDQYIAQRVGSEAMVLATTPPSTLSNGNARITYSGAGQVVHPRSDPSAAWDAWFAGFSGPPELQDELRDRRLRLLDGVSSNIGELRGRLPTEDRHKLDAHLDGIQTLEQKISQPLTLTCEDDPIKPPEPAGYDPDANAWLPETHRRQMDLMAQAFACGLTDVGVLQLVGAGGGQGFTPAWANDPINPLSIPRDVHNICHDYSNDPSDPVLTNRRVALETWSSGQFAYMLDSLKAIPEGSGTLLDNTVVVCVRELGYDHYPLDMLFMLAGGANAGLSLGRYKEYNAAPHNDLLARCCQLMGLDDVDVFGDPQYASGSPLPL